jgi:tRNA A-37 threonylcarbamoyl transferase component Bud32
MSVTDTAPGQGSQIGPYEIVDALAKGGMATVFRARHKTLQREVALKLIRNDVGGDDDQQLTERLRREATAVAAIRHPHVVEIYDANVTQEPFYIAMELLSGGSLQTRLRAYAAAGKKMPFDEAVRITREMASALDYAHSRKFVHRDIKPSNVMFAADGRAVLTDFGIVALKEGITRLTKTQNAIGTPAYMSPEQAKGIAVDGRSDLYSLGIMLYEMLAGTTPFDGGDTPWAMLLKHINEPPPPIVKHRPDTSPALQALLSTALNKQPEARYQTAAQMIAALDAITHPQGPPIATTAAATQTKPAGRSAVRTIGLLTAAAVLSTTCFGAGYGAAWLSRPVAAPITPEGADAVAVEAAVRATVAALDGAPRPSAERAAGIIPKLPTTEALPGPERTPEGAVIGKALIDGDAVQFETPAEGAPVRITYDAKAGERIDIFGTSSRTAPSYQIGFVGPDGTFVASERVSTGATEVLRIERVPTSGQYNIVIQTLEAGTGTGSINVARVLQLGDIQVNGDPVEVAVQRAKQTAVGTFDAVIGDELGLGIATTDDDRLNLGGMAEIIGPDGRQHSFHSLPAGPGHNVSVIRVTGTYTLVVAIDSDDVMQPIVTLSRPISRPIELGVTQSFEIDRPAQVAQLTLNGKAGQSLRLTATNRDDANMLILKLLDSSGKEIGNLTAMPSADGAVDFEPLPSDGIYTLVAAPFAGRTGAFSLTLSER